MNYKFVYIIKSTYINGHSAVQLFTNSIASYSSILQFNLFIFTDPVKLY